VSAVVPSCCPYCDGGLEQESEEVAATTELPPNTQPVITAYRVPVEQHVRCSMQVQNHVEYRVWHLPNTMNARMSAPYTAKESRPRMAERAVSGSVPSQRTPRMATIGVSRQS